MGYVTVYHWLTAHSDMSDEVFGKATLDRLAEIRFGLDRHGYALKLHVGKRSTQATVTNRFLRAKSIYKSLSGFMAFEEARIARMDQADPTTPADARADGGERS